MAFFSRTTGSGRPSGAKSRSLITLVQIGSLLATGGLVWWAALIPRLHRQTLSSLLFQVLGYTVLAWAWSAVVAFGLYSVVPLEDRGERLPDAFRTAATAVWFGPAMILLSQFSLASLAPALVLVIFASRLLYAQWMPVKGDSPPRIYIARVPGSFADCQLPVAFVWRERIPSLAVAFCVEAGAIAVAGHFPLLGAAWLCLATALLTVFSMATGAADAGKPPTLPKSLVGILATVILAFILTLAQGVPGGGSGFGLGQRPEARPNLSLIETARLVLKELFYGETPPGRGGGGRPAPQQPPDTPRSTDSLGGFPGVILWPETKPVVTLIAPLPALGSNPFLGHPSRPLSIPFGGEYWLFRWPYERPPSTSFFKRGTPSKMAFSTTDHTALRMEAHQKLEVPIDVGCCGAIQLEIANADRLPGTLSVELVLLDGRPVVPMPLSLGTLPVTSRPDLSRDPVVPMLETLTFTMPADSTIAQFTEFKIIFHRARSRADKSARVSVERFVLLPR